MSFSLSLVQQKSSQRVKQFFLSTKKRVFETLLACSQYVSDLWNNFHYKMFTRAPTNKNHKCLVCYA